jgi:hypothetical protein
MTPYSTDACVVTNKQKRNSRSSVYQDLPTSQRRLYISFVSLLITKNADNTTPEM